MKVHRNCCGLDVHKKIIAECHFAVPTASSSNLLNGLLYRTIAILRAWSPAAPHCPSARVYFHASL